MIAKFTDYLNGMKVCPDTDSTFCDVTFVCLEILIADSSKVKWHRILLKLVSYYLQTLLLCKCTLPQASCKYSSKIVSAGNNAKIC